MNKNYKSFILIILIAATFMMGCDRNISDNTQASIYNIKIDADLKNMDINEKYFLCGSKIKELKDSNSDDAAILVNGEKITIYEIESCRILTEIFETDDLKERINDIIRDKVVESEANKNNIEPDSEELEAYLEQSKTLMETGETPYINEYIKGRGITQEEYFNELAENEYKIRKNAELYNIILEDWYEKMKNDKNRETDENMSDEEYIDKYVDNLVKEAKIEYLNNDIKKSCLNNNVVLYFFNVKK